MQGGGGGATNLSTATTAASSSTSTPTALAEAMQLSLVASGCVCGGVDDGSLPSSFATAASPPSVRHSSALWSRDGSFILDCAPAPAGQMSGASIAPPAGGWRRRCSNGSKACLLSRRSPAPTRPGQKHCRPCSPARWPRSTLTGLQRIFSKYRTRSPSPSPCRLPLWLPF